MVARFLVSVAEKERSLMYIEKCQHATLFQTSEGTAITLLVGQADPDSSPGQGIRLRTKQECERMANDLLQSLKESSQDENCIFSFSDFTHLNLLVDEERFTVEAIHKRLDSIYFENQPMASSAADIVKEIISLVYGRICEQDFGCYPIVFNGLAGTRLFTLFLDSFPLTAEDARKNDSTKENLARQFEVAHPEYALIPDDRMFEVAKTYATVAGTSFESGPLVNFVLNSNMKRVYYLTDAGQRFLQCAVPDPNPFGEDSHYLTKAEKENLFLDQMRKADTENKAYAVLKHLHLCTPTLYRGLKVIHAFKPLLELIHDKKKKREVQELIKYYE